MDPDRARSEHPMVLRHERVKIVHVLEHVVADHNVDGPVIEGPALSGTGPSDSRAPVNPRIRGGETVNRRFDVDDVEPPKINYIVDTAMEELKDLPSPAAGFKNADRTTTADCRERRVEAPQQMLEPTLTSPRHLARSFSQ
jgi:hypothetical protein